MKNTVIFVAFVLLVLGLLYAISGKRVPPPFVPRDSMHLTLQDPVSCMNCHGPGKDAAIKKKHPPKYECLKCHKPAKELM